MCLKRLLTNQVKLFALEAAAPQWDIALLRLGTAARWQLARYSELAVALALAVAPALAVAVVPRRAGAAVAGPAVAEAAARAAGLGSLLRKT